MHLVQDDSLILFLAAAYLLLSTKSVENASEVMWGKHVFGNLRSVSYGWGKNSAESHAGSRVLVSQVLF